MRGWSRWLIVLLCVWSLGCHPAPIDRGVSQSSAAPVEIPAAPIAAILTSLSEQTNVRVSDLRLERVEAVNWSDACLELAQPDQVCAQMITPGFRVEFSGPQGRYVVHSDRSGQSIRLEP